jgi:hypothetical protein
MLRPQPKRFGPDDWPTPDCVCEAATRFVLPQLPPGAVWEMAPGDGALADAMQAAGREVATTTTDFLTTPPPSGVRIACTNPPFHVMNAFLARGLELLDAGALDVLVLLHRHDHLQNEGRDQPKIRLASLNRAAAFFHCGWRPRWIVGSKGHGRHGVCWVAWLRPGVIGPHGSVWLRKRRNGRIEIAS